MNQTIITTLTRTLITIVLNVSAQCVIIGRRIPSAPTGVVVLLSGIVQLDDVGQNLHESTFE